MAKKSSARFGASYFVNAKLESIFQKGNRSSHFGISDNSNIICRDGFSLSVVAGGIAFSIPRVGMCNLQDFGDKVPCDYMGPYSAVEVFVDTAVEVFGYVPNEEVVALVNRHGGTDIGATKRQAKGALHKYSYRSNCKKGK